MKKSYEKLLAIGIALICLSMVLVPAHALKSNLRVGFNAGFELYQFLDEEGNPQGIHVDLMNAIAEQQDFSLEYVAYESDAACYKALAAGEIDVVLGAPINNTMQYEFRQTNSLSSYELCLITSNETAAVFEEKGNLSGYFGAIEQGHNRKVFSQYGIRNRTIFTNNTYYVANSQKQILDWLISGKISLAVCEREGAIEYLERLGLSDEYTVAINYLVQAESVIMVRNSDVSLFRRIESGLAGIQSSGDYSAILDKWLASDMVFISNEVWKTILFVAMGIVVAVLVYITFTTHLRKLLRKQVAIKTHQLQEANEVLEHNLALLSRENEFRNSIIQNTSNAAIIVDSANCVSFLNRQALTLLGMPAHRAKGQCIENLPLFGSLLSRSKEYETAKPVLISLEWKGRERTYRCNRYLLPDENDTLFFVEDVTIEEQKKQYYFETEKNRVLNTVIAGIAHEIKNPLTAIRAYSTLIPAQKEDKAFIESFARFVPRETERINTLIESLINYARPSQSKAVEIKLDELVNTCVGITASLAQQKGIEIKVYPEGECTIFGARDHIQQAIMNYLLNAIDAVQQRKEQGAVLPPDSIRIYIRTVDERVQLEVFDMGVGMSEDQLKQCMDPFYTTKAKGTGLGMAVAQQRLHENGGEVRVDSEEDSYTRIIVDFERCSN